jgi:hypothetical protein
MLCTLIRYIIAPVRNRTFVSKQDARCVIDWPKLGFYIVLQTRVPN